MFIERFLQLCEIKGKKPSPLLKELGFSVSNLQSWKRGILPLTQTAQILADYFGVTTDYLLGNTVIPTNKELPKNEIFNMLADSENLSEQSRKQLKEYLELLKIRDIKNDNIEVADEFGANA